MRTRSSRIASLLAALLLVVAMLAGCGQATATPNPTQQPTAQPTASASPAATSSEPPEALLPIVTQPLTLTYFTTGGGADTYKTYNDINCYKVMEQRTGIHMDFRNIAGDQSEEQFNLMIASGDLPDIVDWDWTTVKKPMDAFVSDGTFIKLNDWVAQYAPNYTKFLNDNPEYRKEITTDGGNLTGFMTFNVGADFGGVWYGPIMRGDWLAKFNLQKPVTLDDWHTVLAAFKNGNPNGDGKTIYPLTFNSYGTGLDCFQIGNGFLNAWGVGFGYYQKDGTVKYGPMEPEFKDFLTKMNQWYKEGLIDPDYAATDSKTNNAKVLSGQIGVIFSGAGGGIGYYSKSTDKQSGATFVAVPYPVLKAGDKPQMGQNDGNVLYLGAVITSACKHVKEAVKWFDYKFSDEGSLLFNFGVEGTDYTMVNGVPTLADTIIHQDNNSVPRIDGNHAGPSDVRGYLQSIFLPEQQQALGIWYTSRDSRLPATLSIDPADITKNATKETDIQTYVNEMVNKFIMGAEPVSNFDDFVGKLKATGIDDLIKSRQTALDKFNAR